MRAAMGKTKKIIRESYIDTEAESVHDVRDKLVAVTGGIGSTQAYPGYWLIRIRVSQIWFNPVMFALRFGTSRWSDEATEATNLVCR